MTATTRLNVEDDTRIRALRHGLAQRHLSLQYRDAQGALLISENLPDAWPKVGETEAADRIRTLEHAVLDGSRSASTELESRDADGRLVQEVTCTPDLDDRGNLRGIVTVVADVTQARDRDMAIVSLMREVSHRSKNLLAIVLSIAAQTAQHAGNTEDFLEKFHGRIQALSLAQDLVTESNWLGTPFQSLVLAQLARGGQGKIRVEGDNPTLGPNAAMHVGLAIHELIANSIRYGALSTEEPGRVRVSATLEAGDDNALQLVIDWSEAHPLDRAPVAPHFGTVVLEQIVPRSLGGEAEFAIGRHKVHYRLTMPRDQFTV